MIAAIAIDPVKCILGNSGQMRPIVVTMLWRGVIVV